jgi:hypothetical protein
VLALRWQCRSLRRACKHRTGSLRSALSVACKHGFASSSLCVLRKGRRARFALPVLPFLRSRRSCSPLVAWPLKRPTQGASPFVATPPGKEPDGVASLLPVGLLSWGRSSSLASLAGKGQTQPLRSFASALSLQASLFVAPRSQEKPDGVASLLPVGLFLSALRSFVATQMRDKQTQPLRSFASAYPSSGPLLWQCWSLRPQERSPTGSLRSCPSGSFPVGFALLSLRL